MLKPVILIVDDDLAVLNGVGRDLRQHYGQQYQVIKANSGHEALEIVQQLSQRNEIIALFVADQRMPFMEGTEFLVEALKFYPEARTVLLTAYADTQAAISSINEIGLDYYLMKPWDPPEQHLKTEQSLYELLLDTERLRHLIQRIQMQTSRRIEPKALARSDRENTLTDWLDERQVENAWQLAPDLVTLGFTVDEIEALADGFSPEELHAILLWVTSGFSVLSVVEEVNEAAQRVSELVKALKSYTYLDRAPVLNVDIREGIENTLVMFRSKLGRGVVIHRDYADNLPLIEAYSTMALNSSSLVRSRFTRLVLSR